MFADLTGSEDANRHDIRRSDDGLEGLSRP